jgi:hypothetical protein
VIFVTSIRELLEEKNKQMKGREERIALLEKEIADILGRNNILINEKERMKEHEQVAKIFCTPFKHVAMLVN